MEIMNQLKTMMPYLIKKTVCKEDAEDILQSVALRLWEHKDRLIDEPLSKQFGYAYKIAYSIICDRHRRSKSVRHKINRHGLPKYQLPEAYAILELQDVMKKLEAKPKFKQVIDHVEGYKMAEIAEKYGLNSIHTACARNRYAREYLKENEF